MATRKAMVAGNWKMNGSLELVEQLPDAVNIDQSSDV
nr:triose-phosphate isomerase [Pseudoalteromonas sp.]